MASEMETVPVRWTQRFVRTDAEQPVRALRMVLAEVRMNQWVLLQWRRREEASRFYPVKKMEILPRLEGADPEISVVLALHLDAMSPAAATQVPLTSFESRG